MLLFLASPCIVLSYLALLNERPWRNYPYSWIGPPFRKWNSLTNYGPNDLCHAVFEHIDYHCTHSLFKDIPLSIEFFVLSIQIHEIRWIQWCNEKDEPSPAFICILDNKIFATNRILGCNTPLVLPDGNKPTLLIGTAAVGNFNNK